MLVYHPEFVTHWLPTPPENNNFPHFRTGGSQRKKTSPALPGTLDQCDFSKNRMHTGEPNSVRPRAVRFPSSRMANRAMVSLS